MQYLLTEDEMKALSNRAQKGDKAPDKEALQKLCTMVADYAPATRRWDKTITSPIGCILSENGNHYCDDCPAQDICPNVYKEWSK